jgi:beta-lactam-binding protein with PASTA domain/uncharacterized protein YhjY with autotransporter beta-barrel domain
VVSDGPANVTVPDVVGQAQATAQGNITGAGLTVGAVTTANDPVIVAGNVISQNPVGGTDAAQGTAVDLVVSAGPTPVAVPDVVGLSQAAATTAIEGIGLVVDVSTANDPDVAAGNVISQDPVGGTDVAPGSTVNLAVSLGPEPVEVPDVVGQAQDDATTAIEGAGFVANVTGANDPDVPEGTVIGQDPAGGASAPPGSTVTLVVSLGPSGIRGEGPISSIAGLSDTEKEAAIGLETTCNNIRIAGTGTSGQAQLLGLCDTLTADSSSAADVAETLSAISGQQITAQQSTSIDFAKVQMGNIGSRVSALRRLGLEATRGVSTAGLNLNMDGRSVPLAAFMDMGEELLLGGGASADQQQDDSGGAGESRMEVTVVGQRPRLDPRLGFFMNGSVGFGDKDPTDNEPGFDFDSRGLTIGLDYLFTDDFVGGFALGYGNAETQFFGNTGEQQSDSVSGTLFGTLVRDRWFLSGMLGSASVEYDSLRQISASLLSEDAVAEGTTDGDSVFGGVSLEYDFGTGPWSLSPVVALKFIEADIGGFSETGAGGLNLMYGDQTAKSTTARFGLRLGYTFSNTWGELMLEGRSDYVQEFETDRQLIRINFSNDPFINDRNQTSSDFFVLPTQPDEGFLIWGIGLSYAGPSGISGFIDYQTVLGLRGITISEVTAGLRFQWQF